MYIYLYIYIHIYIYTYIHIHIYVCVCIMCIYVGGYMSMQMYVHVCENIHPPFPHFFDKLALLFETFSTRHARPQPNAAPVANKVTSRFIVWDVVL
jgi:hypothetical protein